VRVSTWVWAKIAGFIQHRSKKRRLRPAFSDAQGVWLACLVHVSVPQIML